MGAPSGNVTPLPLGGGAPSGNVTPLPLGGRGRQVATLRHCLSGEENDRVVGKIMVALYLRQGSKVLVVLLLIPICHNLRVGYLGVVVMD